MIEVIYSIDNVETSMFAPEAHAFYLRDETWVKAEALKVNDEIFTRCGTLAKIITINHIEDSHHVSDLKISHNHNYFLSPESMADTEKTCDKAPTDPLNLVAYKLANRPSNQPNGNPTGAHAGPWAAASYFNRDTSEEVTAWGRANENMCAEDAAVKSLKEKLGAAIRLHRGNVKISHAYVRIYKRVRGRIINTISPCVQCWNNYGDALSDKTIGKSDLRKSGRGYLPPKDSD